MLKGTQKPMLGTPINWVHPLARGLEGCWLFNEGAGALAFDSSGNGNHGTLHNMAQPPTATSGWDTSERGGGLRFDGTNDYVGCISGSSLTWTPVDKERTFSVWFNLTEQLSNDTFIHFFRGEQSGGNSYSFEYGNTGGTIFLMCLIQDSLNANLGFFYHVKTLSINTWYHIVFVASSTGNNKIYLNGQSLAVTDSSWDDNTEINPTSTFICTDTSSGKGTIEGALIYNRVLSAEETAGLYRKPYAMFKVGDTYILQSKLWKQMVGTNIPAVSLLV